MRHPRYPEARLALTLAVLGLLSRTASGQIQLVNMVPRAASGESVQDAEPSLTVNPANPLQIAASAFTWDNPHGSPMIGANAPIYTSTDGGQTWNLVLNVPSAVGAALPTGDIMLHFSGTASGTTSLLYAGILGALPPGGNLPVQVLRTADYRLARPMSVIDTRTTTAGVDQPHLGAATVRGGTDAGKDRLYVGFNKLDTSRTATVDYSLDAAAPAPPHLRFDLHVIETRDTLGQDGYANVPAVHPDGTVYVLFYGLRSHGEMAGTATTDVVVVRDDNWGSGSTPFAALIDASDGHAGRRVVTGRMVVLVGGWLGQQRLGASNLALAVDPRNSRTVYIAWADQPTGTFTQTLHVRRSTDGGANWSSDLKTVPDAVNSSLAINSRGQVAFLYQQLVGTPPEDRWETRLTRTTDAGGATWDDPGVLLANTPASSPEKQYDPYLGDYALVVASGQTFFGVFSANNYPDRANFHASVVYQRYVDWTTHQLFKDAAGTIPVAPSIDPFFFKVTEAGGAPGAPQENR
ncbi:MAG TPA: hypothetical protein VMW75_28210 [Thermoanaerobaculia bacterium]|nr:hypothetical protein [Thermoanaerobaculia bacterium]